MGAVFHLYGAFLLFGFNVVSTCPDGDCRELAFPEFFFFANKRLVNHSIETLQVNDLDMCQLRCYQDPNCVSINFNFNQDSQANNNCELNNATHKSHEKELDAKTGYAYHGTLNYCEKEHCKNGGTCQSGFTDKGYRCLCPLGFTTAHCKQDINECSTGNHNCSHVAECKNTIGSYSCTCKEGYVGDGRNCSDIDECSTGEGNCSHVAICKNTIGSYKCTCQEGYVGDGRSCSDIDECKKFLFPCDVNADCHNTAGSYICTCKAGCTGDGKTCTGSRGMIFTSPYNQESVNGTVGSSVTFTWSFCGIVTIIYWDLRNGKRLVVLYPTGKVSVPAPAPYKKRVSVIFVGDESSGQAKFTISNITKADAGFYTCQLYKREGYTSSEINDHVKLIVES